MMFRKEIHRLGDVSVKMVVLSVSFTADMLGNFGHEVFDGRRKVATVVQLRDGVRIVYPKGRDYKHTTLHGEKKSAGKVAEELADKYALNNIRNKLNES